MVEGGCLKCMKGMLVVLNVIAFIIGAAALSYGIYVLVTGETHTTGKSLGKEQVENGAIFLIIVGSVVFLICFAACIGALKQIVCLLYTSIDNLKDTLQTSMSGYMDPDKKDIRNMWHDYQTTHKCCGVDPVFDLPRVWYLVNISKMNFTGNAFTSNFWPDSDETKINKTYTYPLDKSCCGNKDDCNITNSAPPENLNPIGCYEPIQDFSTKVMYGSVAFGSLLTFIVLICAIFAIDLGCAVQKEKKSGKVAVTGVKQLSQMSQGEKQAGSQSQQN